MKMGGRLYGDGGGVGTVCSESVFLVEELVSLFLSSTLLFYARLKFNLPLV